MSTTAAGGSPSRAWDGDDALLRFVERFALILTEAGWPRMPARVFVCLMADDAPNLTAGQLASKLRVSPAAISGAVRYLSQLGLIRRGREPGERSDHYAIDDDMWYEVILQRNESLEVWTSVLDGGLELVEPEGLAARRLRDSRDFFAFLHDELTSMTERWRERQRQRSTTGGRRAPRQPPRRRGRAS